MSVPISDSLNPVPLSQRGLSIGCWCLMVAAFVAISTRPAAAQERTAVDEQGRMISFERDVVPIFIKHCLECHNEDEAKNDFRIDDPDSVMSYVEPEDAQSSTMFVDYMLSEDPDYLMPPPSHGGPLLPAELAVIHAWIQEGADWPEGLTFAAGLVPAEAAEPVTHEPSEPQTLAGRLWMFQGFFHPATVHFPIALFLFGALFVVLGWKWPAMGTQIPLACLLLGAPTALAATAMGWAFATEQGYGSWTKIDFDSEVFWHRWSGVIVTVSSVLFALIALVGRRKNSLGMERTWKFGLIVIAVLVGLVGHQGGELSYGKDFYPRAFEILLGSGDDADAAEAEDQPAEQTPEEVVSETSSDVADQSSIPALLPDPASGSDAFVTAAAG
ncbi:cytochrome C [Roseiconus nitratireducens]|uniref:Cytochrome C n=1 Tax=Roseiconus nitratireducens TaxID=2605748 RepID=A0A5M6DA65_9BACT|nr:c-type cytochrome domain-containing protein [Roseiconus nitratireducens]KAA5544447.1 cytochrome C [Roseiconus nitratireducens]